MYIYIYIYLILFPLSFDSVPSVLTLCVCNSCYLLHTHFTRVATSSRPLQNVGFFWKRALRKSHTFCKRDIYFCAPHTSMTPS